MAVREVFEAQTLANFPLSYDVSGRRIRAGGVAAAGLQVVAHALLLTYSVEALRAALTGRSLVSDVLDLAVLTGFAVVLFTLAVCVLARRLD
ncbi:MAG: hypothetical protein E3J21_12450 [Anaerolineales bacterium]|nr:MAG: hypothetical protein E3J21_12450 [Anaerolineales bacterium]